MELSTSKTGSVFFLSNQMGSLELRIGHPVHEKNASFVIKRKMGENTQHFGVSLRDEGVSLTLVDPQLGQAESVALGILSKDVKWPRKGPFLYVGGRYFYKDSFRTNEAPSD